MLREKETSKQKEYEIVLLDELVPQDHILRKIDAAVDFSFTTSYDNFAAVMKAIPAAAKANPPLISGGYSKINLFGEEMVISCGVAARALAALAEAGVEIALITTSDLDISLLVRQQDEDAALNALTAAFEL